MPRTTTTRRSTSPTGRPSRWGPRRVTGTTPGPSPSSRASPAASVDARRAPTAIPCPCSSIQRTPAPSVAAGGAPRPSRRPRYCAPSRTGPCLTVGRGPSTTRHPTRRTRRDCGTPRRRRGGTASTARRPATPSPSRPPSAGRGRRLVGPPAPTRSRNPPGTDPADPGPDPRRRRRPAPVAAQDPRAQTAGEICHRDWRRPSARSRMHLVAPVTRIERARVSTRGREVPLPPPRQGGRPMARTPPPWHRGLGARDSGPTSGGERIPRGDGWRKGPRKDPSPLSIQTSGLKCSLSPSARELNKQTSPNSEVRRGRCVRAGPRDLRSALLRPGLSTYAEGRHPVDGREISPRTRRGRLALSAGPQPEGEV